MAKKLKKIKINTVKMINVQDWDDLVQETYGRPYNLQQQDGCIERQIIHITVPEEADDFENDTVPEIVNHPDMGVSFKAWLERDPKQKIPDLHGFGNDFTDMWWDRNFYPDLQTVANDLHAKGLIEAGEYSINVDW